MGIFSAYDDCKASAVKTVHIEGVEAPFYVREMAAGEMNDFLHDARSDGEYNIEHACKVIVLHLCDDKGELLVPKKDRPQAIKELQDFKFTVINQLYLASLTVSGLSQEALEETAKK